VEPVFGESPTINDHFNPNGLPHFAGDRRDGLCIERFVFTTWRPDQSAMSNGRRCPSGWSAPKP
jgi:hypothetical protein